MLKAWRLKPAGNKKRAFFDRMLTEWFKDGSIGVHYNVTVDVSNGKTKDAIKATLQENCTDIQPKTPLFMHIFINEMKWGDYFFLCRGKYEALRVCRFTSECYFDDDEKWCGYQHRRRFEVVEVLPEGTVLDTCLIQSMTTKPIDWKQLALTAYSCKIS